VLMAFFANRPFAIAPYMSENAFIAFVVVKVMGYSWQTALTAVFIAGVLFTLLTLFKVRSWLAESIPLSLKCAFATGIGLFLTFIGLNETGIVALGVPGAPVKLGDLSQPSVLLAIFGLLFTVILMSRKVLGAIMIGIVATTIASIALKVTPLPQSFFSLPPDITPIMFQLDFENALTPAFFPIILTIFIMAFLDTVGTLLGLSMRADLLDEHGNLPEIEKPMLADALATVVAPLLGTTTTGAYIESAAGIEEGGRTGFASLITAFLFLLALFLAPLFTVVPAHAYGIALIIIGSFMISPLTKIDFDDLTELMPAFLTVVLMIFTYNIGVGMTAGFVAYPLMKLATGRIREMKGGMWVLALLSMSYFLFGAK
jgi:adenine/guanine/hypoxanthine permease